jgi:benzoyl-CoA reductase/2-hydroxyglutaryl-CoA dehydratase subunit BcrC/BadD/HgdB
MYGEFLKLCGYQPEEIKREIPRLNRTFESFSIGAQDVENAKKRIERFFDVRLNGMRKFIGIWLKEFTDMALAKENKRKIVYCSFPPVSQFAAALALMADDVYCCIPELITQVVIGQFFGKLNPIFEEAEKHYMPPGQATCPLQQVRLGLLQKGLVPVPDLLVPSGVSCDQSPKTDELIGWLYGIPVAHLDNRGDEAGDKWPLVEPRRIKYFVQEMKNAANLVKQVTGHELTEDTIVLANSQFARLLGVQIELGQIRKANPTPLSFNDIQLINLARASCGKRFVEEGPEAGDILVKEVKQRVEQGLGVQEKDIPRVLVVSTSSCDPTLVEVIEKSGLAIALDAAELTKAELGLPKYESIWEQVAGQTLGRPSRHSTLAFITALKNLAREFNVDGAILNTIIKCRVYSIFPRKAKEVIESELGIPALVVEQDPMDSREYTPDQLKSRIEPFAEMLRARHPSTLH